jgi:hypothetical protein
LPEQGGVFFVQPEVALHFLDEALHARNPL